MIQILLAEDHVIVRESIKTMLEEDEDLRVIGEASDGTEVLTLLEAGLKPDIILSDVSMPVMDGLELSRRVSEQYSDIKMVILSMMDSDRYIYDAFAAGVKGYLLKNTSPSEMRFALHHVASNKELICAELRMQLLWKNINKNPAAPDEIQVALSAREKEVLLLIAEGLTSDEIAIKLFTSRRTVEGHRLSMIQKMDVKNTAQLIKKACKLSVI